MFISSYETSLGNKLPKIRRWRSRNRNGGKIVGGFKTEFFSMQKMVRLRQLGQLWAQGLWRTIFFVTNNGQAAIQQMYPNLMAAPGDGTTPALRCLRENSASEVRSKPPSGGSCRALRCVRKPRRARLWPSDVGTPIADSDPKTTPSLF